MKIILAIFFTDICFAQASGINWKPLIWMNYFHWLILIVPALAAFYFEDRKKKRDIHHVDFYLEEEAKRLAS